MNAYRTTLHRSVPEYKGPGAAVWPRPFNRLLSCMLNPSTADGADGGLNDPTIRKNIGFASRWGFSELLVGNLYSLRATDPKDLHRVLRTSGQDIAIGAENDSALLTMANAADMVLVAWGANAQHPLVAERVTQFLELFKGHRLFCISTTKDGHPSHPCMHPYTQAPVLWRGKVQTCCTRSPANNEPAT